MSLRNKISQWFCRGFNKNIDDFGIQSALNILLKHNHIHFRKIIANPDTNRVLARKASIIVCNHPHQIEPIIILGSTPPRKNVHIVADARYLNLTPALEKHIIPVYIKHNYTKQNHHGLRVAFIDWLIPQDTFDYQTSHQKNIQNIDRASHILSENGLIIICPIKRDNSWSDGIGYLVKGVGQSVKSLNLIMAYVQGGSRFDIFRLFPFVNLFFPTIKIFFSSPIELIPYQKSQPKEIKLIIETKYNQWVKKLNLNHNL